MYAPCYYFWTQPFCPLPFSHSLYPASLPSFPQLYHSEPQIANMSQESPNNAHNDSSERVKEEEEVNRSQSSSKASRFKYPKKNVQSNVVSQVISFLTNKSKSHHILRKLLSGEDKIDAFYEILRQAKKKNRRYMGRAVLQGLLEIDEDHPIHTLYKKLKHGISLKLGEIRRVLVRLTNYFLRNLIVNTLLTSSKLDKSTVKQHLLRAREILCYVNNKPYPSLI